MTKIDSSKTEGNYLVSYEINTSSEEEKVRSVIHQLLGDDYVINGKEIGYIIALFFLGESLISTKELSRDVIINYLYKTKTDTLFGHLQFGQDNTITRSIVLNKIKSSGIVFDKFILKTSYEAGVWNDQFIQKRVYSCNWRDSSTDKFERSTIKIGIILSLSGAYSHNDRKSFNLYLMIIDYYNIEMKGIRGLIIVPTFVDVKSDVSLVKDSLLYLSSNNINSVIGLSNSEMRKASLATLEEKNLVLFYPHNYEGLECKRNIIYVGVPFTSHVSVRYYIQRDVLQTKRRVAIVYTNTLYYKTAVEILTEDLNAIGITVSYVSKTNYDASDMNSIVNELLYMLLGGGIIISLIDGDLKYQFYEVAYQNFLVEPAYTFYTFGIDSSVLHTEYAKYFSSHYLITEAIEVDNEITQIIKKYKDDYYPYIDYFDNGMYYSILSIMLWRETIENKKSYQTELILQSVNKLSFSSPFGVISTSSNHHISIPRVIARVIKSDNNKYEFNFSLNSGFTVPSPYSTKYLGNVVFICDWRKSVEQQPTISVNFLIVLSPNDETSYLSIIAVTVSCIDDINSKNGIMGYTVNPLFIIYNDEDVTLKDKLEKTMVENPLNLLYIGCTTSFCLNTISPLLIKYHRLLLYPIKFQAEICHPAILATGPIPNQIIGSAITYISSLLVTKNIVLLYSSNTKWNVFKEVFKESIGDQYSIVYEKEIDDYSYFSMSMVNNIIGFLANGGFIISFLSEKPLLSILNYLNVMIVDVSYINFEIYNFRIPPYTIKTELPDLKFPYYYVSGLDDPVEDSGSLRDIKQILDKYYGNMNITDDSVSVAITIYGLVKLAETAKTINITVLKQYLFTTYLTDDKTTRFSTSNYMVRDIYIYKYANNVGSIVRTFQGTEPQSFNWKLDGNYGKMCDTRLVIDFVGNPVITVDIMNVILVTSTTGANQLDYRGISEVFQQIIDNINSNGGLRNKRINYEIIDDQSDTTICSDSIKRRLSEIDNLTAIFTTGGQLCVDLVVSSLIQYNVKLFHIGIFGGESCESNVFHFGIEPTTIERHIEIMMNKGINNFGIISTSEAYHMKFYTYAERYINYLYGTVSLAATVEESINDCKSLAQNIKSKLVTQNTALLLFVNVNVHRLLSTALKYVGINDNDYTIFSFSTYENVAFLDDGNILPFYSVAHYFNTIKSEENSNFIEEIKLSLSNDVKINAYHESIYTAIELWERTVKDYSNIEIKDLNLQYYNLNLSTAAGYMVMHSNNIVYRNIYLSYYDGNEYGGFTIVSNSDYGYPTAWKQFINSGIYVCDFIDPSIGQKYKSPSISIGIMASLTGIDELRGREIVCSVLLVTRRVNREGGLIGSRIEVEIFDTESNFDTYKQKALSISQIPELSAVFGAAWDDEYKMLIQYFNKVGKLFFFSGTATSDGCENYGVVTQDTFIQLITVTQYTLVKEGTNEYIIIYSSHRFSVENLKIFSGFLDSINIKYIKYEYDSTNNEIFEEIRQLYPNGVKIVDVGSTWYALEMSIRATKAGLVYPKYKFYHYFVDEYLLNGNEKYFEGHIFLSSWFAVVGKAISKGYENQRSFYREYVETYSDSIRVSSTAEATYTSVELWISGVKESYSFESSLVKKGMLGKKIKAGSDRIRLEINNIVSRKIYTAQVIDGVLVLITSTTEAIYPYSYANWMPDNQGKECDWVNNNGTYIKQNIKRVGIILESDFRINTEIYNAWISFKDALNEINLEGGINGIDFYESSAIVPLDDVENSTIQLIENEKIYALFGCLSIKCRDIVSVIAEEYKKMFFYIGNNGGEYFSKYTFSISSTIIQNLNVALAYTNKMYKNYYLLIDQQNYDLYFDKITTFISAHTNNQLLGYYEITDKIKCSIIMRNIASASSIYNHMIIITVLSKSNFEECMEYYVNNRLIRYRYYLLILNYNHYEYLDIDINTIVGSYISLSYHQSNTYFRNYAFKKRVSSVLDAMSYISPYYENCYSSINIFKLAVEKASHYDSRNELPESDYVRLTIPKIQYQSPSGVITMTINNYAERPMYLLEIIREDKFLQVNPEIGTIESYNPYPFITYLPKESENVKSIRILKRSEIMKWFGFCLCLFSILVSLLCLIYTIKFRKNRIIKCSSPLYYYCLIFGLIMSAISIIYLTATPTSSSVICYIRINLCLFSVMFVSSMLFVKAAKYNFSRKKRIHKIKITPFYIVKIFLFSYFFPLVVSVVYQIVSQPSYTLQLSEKDSSFLVDSFYEECSQDDIFNIIIIVYVVIYILYGLYLSFHSRQKAIEFGDSYSLLITYIVEFFMLIILFVLEFVINSTPDYLLLFRGIGYPLVIIAITLVQFVPKILFMFTDELALDVTDSSMTESMSVHQSQSSVSYSMNHSINHSINRSASRAMSQSQSINRKHI